MPVKVLYKNISDQICTIRPTPLVTIDTNILKTGAGDAYGVTYSITLTGKLLADQGTPYAFKKTNGNPKYPIAPFGNPPTLTYCGPYEAFDRIIGHDIGHPHPTPPKQSIDIRNALDAILSKQAALKALFALDGQKLEISDWDYVTEEVSIVCFPRVTNISFTEGIYVDTCDYTITLEADTLLDNLLNLEEISTLYSNSCHDGSSGIFLPQDYQNIKFTGTGIKEAELVGALSGAFIQDYSESWSIEEDDTQSESVDPFLPKTYRVTHNLSATGKSHYRPTGDVEDPQVVKTDAWYEAKKFVQGRLIHDADAAILKDDTNVSNHKGNVSGVYPNAPGLLGTGIFNLIPQYRGYNHSRTENIDKGAGSYSCTETFLLASGNSYENYTLDISSSTDNPFVSVSMNGTIKGLADISPSGYQQYSRYDQISPLSEKTAYTHAIGKYNQVSNSGRFGIGCDLYKRANNSVAVALNSQPKSVTLGVNEFTGEINYSLSFDNRPTNIISGVLSETISVNDTYPGDVFATIPVLGRATGPVLQYMGTRTEYRRDLSINLTLDYTKVPYGKERNPLLLKKPSIVQPMAQQLHELIIEMSPANEYGIRKYFISPPSESWNPKEGQYSLNISWTYELDQ
jgi:hypothetical protein